MSKLRYPWLYYIWDLGGTLLDNYEASTKAFLAALAEIGVVASHDAVYQALRVSTDHAISLFAPGAAGFSARYRQLEAQQLDFPTLFPGAQQVLAAVVAAGGANYLVSHRDDGVYEILRHCGIARYFTEVLTKSSGFARKPSPAAFEHLIAKYQLPVELTATVGDRVIDVEAGAAAGIATIYFDAGATCRAATYSISRLGDLLESR